jgi:hypothetical protein
VRSVVRAMLVVAALTLVSRQPARAQDSASHAQDLTSPAPERGRHGWIVGPLVGLPGAGSDAAYPLVTLGVGVTRLVPNAPGLDFAIGTVPYALAFGLARGAVGLRVGVTWHQLPHSEPSVWLVEVGVMHVPVPRYIR